MSSDFTTEATADYRKSYREGWNAALKTTISGLAIEYRSDSELDKYTINVVLGLLMGLQEDELHLTYEELKGRCHVNETED